MEKLIYKVEEFNKAFGLPIRTEVCNIDRNEIALQYRLLVEEINEYAEAASSGDLVEVADALGDILYVLFGTMIRHGMQDRIVNIFNEIHRSNMSKLDENGRPIYNEDGKVVKGPNFSPPNIKALLL
jgi:predicted HAD superfamily Cof-like phosphohydrolase